MSGFTPGPWSYSVGNLVRVNKGDRCIAGIHKIGMYSVRFDPAEIAANAQLIASAPDLLSALQSLSEYVHGAWFDEASATDAEREMMRQARAAIQKATGGRG